jgi:lysophospholipase L1-like esterase
LKEAVSGTTLRQENPADLSYLSRFLVSEAYQKRLLLDAIIVQLSTNDGWDPSKLGTPLHDEDPRTTFGAIAALISAASARFACPLYFYTGARYGGLNARTYQQMVEGLREIAQKRGIEVIDLFSDEEFNAIGRKNYAYWMDDGIHPRRAGYRAWWTPYFRDFLERHLGAK